MTHDFGSTVEEGDGDDPPAAANPSALARLVRGTNINETTLLATDYLNHFNEIIMFLEMIPEMPEILEDAKAWVPKCYAEHFRDSAFTDRELAIVAYEKSPPQFREPFDRTIGLLNTLVREGIGQIEPALATGHDGAIAEAVTGVTRELRSLVDVAGAIIHGSARIADQSEVDAILSS